MRFYLNEQSSSGITVGIKQYPGTPAPQRIASGSSMFIMLASKGSGSLAAVLRSTEHLKRCAALRRQADTTRTDKDFVFCHSDLSLQNIIVDPESLKINAIIDWEYAGFFPPSFERRFFKRNGPSVALEGEQDDSEKILEFLQAQSGCLQTV